MERTVDGRLLELLQSLLDLPALELESALTAAATVVARWFDCDKVDAFLLDESRGCLVAVGTSKTPLGERQKELGLDVVALDRGGLLGRTFHRGESFIIGRAELDPDELPGVVHGLGVRSELNVILTVGGAHRGVLSVVDRQPERFDAQDLRLVELIARWVGALAHRAELVERLKREESARARTTAAEQIVTVLSHDIRNYLGPLSARLLLHQQRLRQGQTVDPASLDPALEAVKRLARLTNSWLDLSRLEQHLFELELEPLELGALLKEAIAPLSTQAVPIQLVTGPELTILGDRDRLTQAFENVLANGVRHSPPGRPLRVVVSSDDDSELARIEVSDEGPGILPELLPHLFERFVSTRPSRGIGLGLYLAERVVAAHGGSLSVESELGRGACFTFRLPREGPRS